MFPSPPSRDPAAATGPAEDDDAAPFFLFFLRPMRKTSPDGRDERIRRRALDDVARGEGGRAGETGESPSDRSFAVGRREEKRCSRQTLFAFFRRLVPVENSNGDRAKSCREAVCELGSVSNNNGCEIVFPLTSLRSFAMAPSGRADRPSGMVGKRELLSWASSMARRDVASFADLGDGDVLLRCMRETWPMAYDACRKPGPRTVAGNFELMADMFRHLGLPRAVLDVAGIRASAFKPCYNFLVMTFFLRNLALHSDFSVDFTHPVDPALAAFLQAPESVASLAKGGALRPANAPSVATTPTDRPSTATRRRPPREPTSESKDPDPTAATTPRRWRARSEPRGTPKTPSAANSHHRPNAPPPPPAPREDHTRDRRTPRSERRLQDVETSTRRARVPSRSRTRGYRFRA